MLWFGDFTFSRLMNRIDRVHNIVYILSNQIETYTSFADLLFAVLIADDSSTTLPIYVGARYDTDVDRQNMFRCCCTERAGGGHQITRDGKRTSTTRDKKR